MQVACFQQRLLWASGRNLQVWHSTICCRKYLTLSETLFLSDLSWLSYKLLFVRQDPSTITLGGKPSHGRSCHLEADLFSRLTDSAPSLRLPLLSVFVSIPLSPFSITPTPCSAVCLDQTAPASISDFQSISGTAPLTVVCLSVSFFGAPTAGGSGSWIHQGRKLIAFTIYIKVWKITLQDHCHPSSPSILF